MDESGLSADFSKFGPLYVVLGCFLPDFSQKSAFEPEAFPIMVPKSIANGTLYQV